MNPSMRHLGMFAAMAALAGFVGPSLPAMEREYPVQRDHANRAAKRKRRIEGDDPASKKRKRKALRRGGLR